MCRIKVKLPTLIGKMLNIETTTGIRIDSYYMFDRVSKERITVQNCERTFENHQAYDNRYKFDYLFNDELEKNPVQFLNKCNGFVYVPICLRNQQKAYIFEFNLEDIKSLINPVGDIVSPTYEQLTLPI